MTAEVYLTFDPNVLQVKSNGIKTYNELEKISVANSNNKIGSIHLLATTGKSIKPTGTFDLVTITFTAQKADPQTSLKFSPNSIVISPQNNPILKNKASIDFEVKDAGVFKGQVKFQPGYVSKVVDLRIHVDNAPQTYEARTNNNGIFTIGLPPGNIMFMLLKQILYSLCSQ